MTHPTAVPLAVAPVGAWDRLAIVALGAAGCALSYDALQQMAVAIHVRGLLTYLFPLVIDGFIAYGVRALLVLSTAPLRARAYVWLLFGTATTASIWANALHAVRLNQQTSHDGLRLGDTVVAVLSTLAPLALAGAVHLYILITRHHPHTGTEEAADTGGDRDASVPTADPPVDGDPSRQLHPVPGPGPQTDPSSIGDRAAGGRPAGNRSGPSHGTAVPSRDGDPSVHGDRPSAGDRPDGDGSSLTYGTGLPLGGDHGSVPNTHGDRHSTVPSTDEPTGQATGTGTGHVDRDGATGTDAEAASSGDGPAADPAASVPTDDGNRGQADSVPGTDPNGDRPHRVSETKSQRSGDRSRGGRGKRTRSTPKLSEDEIVTRLRPHVPAVLERDGNSEITRVQLRQIMRAKHISIRNDRLTPVLQRLRTESGSPTTKRSAR
ncbi:DUF2637 domain-containing protein [Streptomyces sp. NBC_00133]|uniref:DUF2637 domain-containing protein n=1 Tax=Streptomyces sp. NBC_00133 TaxID=2903624 RepID=UPI00324EB78C